MFGGPVCISFSLMGNQEGVDSIHFECHKKYYEQAPAKADVLVLENVPQYTPDVVANELGEAWDIKHCIIDPRILGLPAARTRIYLVCYKKKKASWMPGISLNSVLVALTSRVIADASMYLWKKLQPATLSLAKDTCLLASNYFHIIL